MNVELHIQCRECRVTYIECRVTYMNIVIDARMSDNAGQQILSNLFEDIKRSLSMYVTDRTLHSKIRFAAL